MRRLVALTVLLVCALCAQGTPLLEPDSAIVELDAEQPAKPRMSWLRRTIRGFSYIDTNYVEPQHYDYTIMAQMTHTYDIYRLRSTNGQSITFAPAPNIKVGPYIGWRWFFLGYTFDVKNIGFGGNSLKQELDLSIYSAQIGVDLFYRRTGSDYKIRDVKLGRNADNVSLEGRPYDGLSVGITGFNLYYIFNHQRFSYPAAFAQSTCQKLSCGSWMVGIGYTRNSLSFDHEKLQQMVEQYSQTQTVKLDSGLMFNAVRYYDYNVSGGYAYNWVFAKNCLFCASASVALAYKRSVGDVDETDDRRGFRFSNLNLDGIGRFGVVYNNTRWYAGASVIMHAYNYRKSRFAANNVFGSMNLYVGYNFGKKPKYRNRL